MGHVLAATQHLVLMSHFLVGDWTDYGNGEEVMIAIDEDDIPRELNIDTDLVVQLME